MDQQRRGPIWSELDDPALLELLRQTLRHHEQPPSALVDLAKASFGLRRIDAELAALVADSLDDASGPRVRSVRAPRLVSFEAGDLTVELESAPTGTGWRIVGQFEPPGPARIELLRASGPSGTAVDADRLGRFAFDVTDPGPISLLFHRADHGVVATAWILLG